MASRSSNINRPDPAEIIKLPPGASKVKVEGDLVVPSCIKILLEREDHTVGNLIRTQLLRDPTVTFGGYRNPHPLEPQIELRVQTVPTISPHLAVHNALSALQNETGSLLSQFRAKIETKSAVAS